MDENRRTRGKHLIIHKQNLAFPHVTRARLEPQWWETCWIKSLLSYPLGYGGPLWISVFKIQVSLIEMRISVFEMIYFSFEYIYMYFNQISEFHLEMSVFKTEIEIFLFTPLMENWYLSHAHYSPVQIPMWRTAQFAPLQTWQRNSLKVLKILHQPFSHIFVTNQHTQTLFA